VINHSHSAFNNAVAELSRLPGIGEKTAERLVFYLLKQPETQIEALSRSLADLPVKMQYCQSCHNLSDAEICSLCSDVKRENGVICVVEMPQDLSRLESICDYRGRYHVLGGRYAPLEGIFPEDLNIDTLIRRIKKEKIEEVILAINPNTEGEATCELIMQTLSSFSIKISRLATGMAYGSEIEWSSRGALRDAFSFRRGLK
jgi:recombination protein RecR